MLEKQQTGMENQSDVAEENETDIVEGDEETIVNEEEVESEEDETPPSEEEVESEEDETPPSAEDEIDQLKSEYEAKLDRMLRTVAEYENAKKRAIRDKEEFQKYAVESVIKDLLPVIDSMNRAIESAKESTDFNSLHEGIKLIQKQIHNVLERSNVSTIDAVGGNFDPNLHEAIAQVESDLPTNAIVAEFQVGYKLRDRVLRASMVSISQGSSSPETDEEDTKEEVSEEKEDTTDE
ncbi:TPA: nucleotide exchange factor GrpE [Candidatus Poribacteria bacterium]|nr:nucleotide exchange factor GrpE [Candidatus Poribacteria bacterium]HIC02039.1 nucleotide exchange factor GrpE [Candidatus Poribacteria bacterium]HIC18218.1 nucleotide exchange factor GrpE [Candidatus Poribacteria bacterium]HIM11603.1 nucleotide exchange factor GrpE [Candidatus Poribacteria bacterium]HIO50091.1 nucleotide exchange factor GrpE [Candidatus Poribacteria bacterium]